MTDQQKAAVRATLASLGDVTRAHHGDSIGADAEFHAVCLEYGIPGADSPPSLGAGALPQKPAPPFPERGGRGG
jgi:hypothetical protein